MALHQGTPSQMKNLYATVADRYCRYSSGWRGCRVDSACDSYLKDTGSNPAEADHCVATVDKLFTPTVPSEAEGWLIVCYTTVSSGISEC